MTFQSKCRILVVDDEGAVRELLTDFLTRRGYGVVSAGSIAKAREILCNEFFQLLILDVVVGDEDGLDFLDECHRDHPHLPVLILTGLGYDEEILQEALHNGAAGYLSKTLGLRQLEMEIHRVLGWSNIASLGGPRSPLRA